MSDLFTEFTELEGQAIGDHNKPRQRLAKAVLVLFRRVQVLEEEVRNLRLQGQKYGGSMMEGMK